MCHLANISYRVKKDLAVNPANGTTTERSARKLWSRDYARGWEPKV
jgi:hypothetical protein